MTRALCLSFALLLSGCGATPPSSPPPVGSAAPAAPLAEPPPSAAASSAAAPAPVASTAAAAVEEAPKTPPASASRTAVLVDQPKGTPLAVVNVTDGAAACGDKPTEGSTTMELSLYWKPGTYVIGTRTKTASIRVRRFENGKWTTLPEVVKGEVQVIEAPVEQGKSGRIRIRGDRAGQALDEEVDVVLCVPFDSSKGK